MSALFKGYIVFCSKAKHLSSYFENHEEISFSKKTFLGKEILIFSDNLSKHTHDLANNLTSVLVIQSLISANDDLMELFFTLDLLNRINTKNINVLIPYFAYSRQDKIYSNVSSIGFEVICKILFSFGVKNIYSVDIHSNTKEINVINISTTGIFAKHLLNNFNNYEICIISPDFGSKSRAIALANSVKTDEVYFFEKRRISENSVKISDHLIKLNCASESNSSFELNSASNASNYIPKEMQKIPKICVIVDDIISTGNTINSCAEKLRKLGAKKIFCYCSHFLDFAVNKSNLSSIDKIFATNTCFGNIDKNIFSNVEILEIKDICSNF